ncbi:MAG: 4Fe-4S dicluster domain-containing protein [Ignavibacteriales bacterium]|nr:4Fe-4S dicluster domain-containing protein [Ignavibacteriales bacterium]
MVTMETAGVGSLFSALHKRGYKTVAPTIREGAIIYDEVASHSELPVGWTDKQDAASYRLERRSDNALFGYNVGPHSWKKFLFPPIHKLFASQKKSHGFDVQTVLESKDSYAFVGVRPCELAAIAIQDRVFAAGEYRDPYYQAVREKIFIVAVNCSNAGGTCFCASMDTGPRAKNGFDIALTEVIQNGSHYLVAESGSKRGAEVLNELGQPEATAAEIGAAEKILKKTTAAMGRKIETKNLKELLAANPEHPQWEVIAKRCLNCANCTQVCPTCFCANVEDVTDLTGTKAERIRKWDSCFTLEFSYIHGGSIRATRKSRFRQWMTHKLSSWIDQFGTPGCVGCGRCITWCPVGIDITEEARAIREHQQIQITTS